LAISSAAPGPEQREIRRGGQGQRGHTAAARVEHTVSLTTDVVLSDATIGCLAAGPPKKHRPARPCRPVRGPAACTHTLRQYPGPNVRMSIASLELYEGWDNLLRGNCGPSRPMSDLKTTRTESALG